MMPTLLTSLHMGTDPSRKNEGCFTAQRENGRKHYFPRLLAILVVVAALLMLPKVTQLSGIAATTELKSNSNVNTTAGAQIESCTVN